MNADLKKIFINSIKASLDLFKVIIVVSIAVKILKELGAIDYLAQALNPFMNIVGLPGSMGLVWATAMSTNLYAGMTVYASFVHDVQLTTAQITVLTSMMLIAHSLPIELSFARTAGVRLRFTTAMRIFGALFYGWSLNLIFQLTNTLQHRAVLSWFPKMQDETILSWALSEVKRLGLIFIIILSLNIILKLFEITGITDIIVKLLRPFLNVLKIPESASSIIIVGMLLGMVYGSGLIIIEAKKEILNAKDIFSVIVLLSLCHGIIEDTILMMLLGGHISGVLIGRIILSLGFVFTLSRIIAFIPEDTFNKLLFRQAQ
ncbi:MAG: hypothetical protein HZA77_06085 [Candidatus Schekmanbacteria bacterium]|nr:hypothetical protein [Candidatus Schekmanbacteria bacterium]